LFPPFFSPFSLEAKALYSLFAPSRFLIEPGRGSISFGAFWLGVKTLRPFFFLNYFSRGANDSRFFAMDFLFMNTDNRIIFFLSGRLPLSLFFPRVFVGSS